MIYYILYIIDNPLGKVVCVKNSKAKNIDIIGKFKFDPERDYSNDERFTFVPVNYLMNILLFI